MVTVTQQKQNRAIREDHSERKRDKEGKQRKEAQRRAFKKTEKKTGDTPNSNARLKSAFRHRLREAGSGLCHLQRNRMDPDVRHLWQSHLSHTQYTHKDINVQTKPIHSPYIVLLHTRRLYWRWSRGFRLWRARPDVRRNDSRQVCKSAHTACWHPLQHREGEACMSETFSRDVYVCMLGECCCVSVCNFFECLHSKEKMQLADEHLSMCSGNRGQTV